MACVLALLTAPRVLLRLEGVATLAVATALYGVRGGKSSISTVDLRSE